MLESLTILSGGGWFPAHGRQTACALLRDGDGDGDGDGAIMIDAGTGVGRLVEQPELMTGINRLDIVLTHFHLDHLAGLAYLPAIGACEQTIVWGRGRLLYETPTHEIIAPLSHEPFHPVPLEAQDIEVGDLRGTEVELWGARVGLRRQDRHSAPTLGLRFDDALAWITDTAYDEGSGRFAQGCTTLAQRGVVHQRATTQSADPLLGESGWRGGTAGGGRTSAADPSPPVRVLAARADARGAELERRRDSDRRRRGRRFRAARLRLTPGRSARAQRSRASRTPAVVACGLTRDRWPAASR